MGATLLLLTGQAGAGKSTAIRSLEDEGYLCVDNLPVALVEPLLATHADASVPRRLALGMDARDRNFVAAAPALVARLRTSRWATKVVFLEAQHDVVVRRYSETRRLHPLDEGRGLRAAIEAERALLAPLRSLADVLLDTSPLSPHALRQMVAHSFGDRAGGTALQLGVMSFGFKYGLPLEADMVLDVRFLRNPYYDPALRPQTGLQAPVADYVMAAPEAVEFLAKLTDLVGYLLPLYRREGKRYVTVAIGCTGGRHRSVTLVEALGRALADRGVVAQLRHRDIGRVAR